MAKRVTTFRRRTSRPNNAWAGVISSTAVVVPANSSVLLGSLVPSNVNIDETQLRVIGSATIESDASGLETQVGAVGLIVVSNAALAAGVASIPKPATDIDDDGWFCHAQFAQQGQTVSLSPTASHSYPFNSKAKRIVQDGEGIAIMVENIHASFGFEISLQFRILSRVTGT